MSFFTKKNLGFILFCFTLACAPPQAQKEEEKKAPPKKIPSGKLLFEEKKSPSELLRDKTAFFSTRIEMPLPGLYSLNNRYVNYRNQPYSPAFFGYVSDTDGVTFTAKISNDFRNNLPRAIIDEISKHDVDELDIFFAPQKYDGKGFKPHCWAAKNPPATPFGAYTHGSELLVAIYDADYPIDRDIKTGRLTRFSFTIHADTLSPVQPELAIRAPGGGELLSFWSLALFPAEKRAAVTLHLILSAAENGIITGAAATLPTLEDFANHLNANPLFHGSAWMRKLELLLQR